MSTILIADDDSAFRALLHDILEPEGHRVLDASDGAAALEVLRRAHADLIIADQRMPRMNGIDLLREVRARSSTPFVLLTGYGTIPDAVEAVRLGAFDYLTKPLQSPAALLDLVTRAIDGPASGEIIAASRAMRELLETADRVAARDVAVLIEGESGTGKELLARRIHARSPRAAQPFVAVNCAALPETLAESELFGFERGAFTGADRQRAGRFEEAHRGTLFLDEVGELSPSVQAKLLRALEERTIRRLGASKDIAVDVRVLAATNRDLAAAAENGSFRSDLFFRLAVVSLRIPALRERPDDLEPLARHLVAQLSRRHRVVAAAVEPEAMEVLRRHLWPGNVRELRNVLERAVVLRAGASIRAEDVEIRPMGERPLQDVAGAGEKEAILDALRRSNGNREEAARRLHISVRTIYYRLRKLGLN